ncbi:MAG TPA: citrate/2-methylcitrate synthase, partial [Acidimicrobiales bacterium]|nr:citrate/2-methylcitrate synthase [Acidimicrobiales bacterium]
MTTVEMPSAMPPGLKGVAVTDTQIGDVRGLEGFYHYRQYSATELAEKRTLEEVWRLLLDGSLPEDPTARRRFEREIRAQRAIPDQVRHLLPGIAATVRTAGPLDGLRTALSALGAAEGFRPLWDVGAEERRQNLIRLIAVTPSLVAAVHRVSQGLEPIDPDPDLDHAANYLWMVAGTRPDPVAARALEQYL